MFDIEFLSDEPEAQEGGWLGLRGVVTLGTESEEFIAPLSLWSVERYQRHWIEAATRLAAGEERSAFFTSAFQFWWTMWQEEGDIRVHEELLLPTQLDSLSALPARAPVPYHLIGPYRRTTDEGEAISEWRLKAQDIEEFLVRRAAY
ncbi:MAG: hypothetical protein H7Z74_03000 [Anaerolineae bacterium]|nr:hypothetical protein [Gemmatimonadaceae bacterium]